MKVLSSSAEECHRHDGAKKFCFKGQVLDIILRVPFEISFARLIDHSET